MSHVPSDNSTPPLRFKDVTFNYGPADEPVLKNFSLTVSSGEILGVFGTNGCGKSSLLNLAADFLQPDGGRIEIPTDTGIAYLPQQYAETLLPWFKACTNLALPRGTARISATETDVLLKTLLEFFGNPVDLNKRPHELSGGQQQILALLRCFVRRPKLVLLDEPFSAINFHKMFALRQKVAAWAKKSGVSVVMVSHNLDDLAIVCDRILAVVGPPLKIVAETMIHQAHPRMESDLAGAEIIRAKTEIYSQLKDA